MIRRPPRSTLSSSSAASDVYKRQVKDKSPFHQFFYGVAPAYFVVPLSFYPPSFLFPTSFDFRFTTLVILFSLLPKIKFDYFAFKILINNLICNSSIKQISKTIVKRFLSNCILHFFHNNVYTLIHYHKGKGHFSLSFSSFALLLLLLILSF